MRFRYAAIAAFFLGLGFVSHSVIAATIPAQPSMLPISPIKNTSTCIAGFTPSPLNFDGKTVTSYTCTSAHLACAKGTVGQKVTSSNATVIYKCVIPGPSASDDWETPNT